MRDIHGRYRDEKPIQDNGPDWAMGCPKCKHGIVSAPELTRACSLYLERVVQHIAGEIEYCTCQAGIRYRVHLQNVRQRLIEEARRDPRMEKYARQLTHPDIENAAFAISTSYAMASVPTIHYEPAAHPHPAGQKEAQV